MITTLSSKFKHENFLLLVTLPFLPTYPTCFNNCLLLQATSKLFCKVWNNGIYSNFLIGLVVRHFKTSFVCEPGLSCSEKVFADPDNNLCTCSFQNMFKNTFFKLPTSFVSWIFNWSLPFSIKCIIIDFCLKWKP